MSEIKNNLFAIKQKINHSCKIFLRNPLDVRLVAVSKRVEAEKICEAAELGVVNFGENYVQEAQEKWIAIKQKYPSVKLHLIGHLQSNKAREALDLFDCIESLDSEKLARELQKQIARAQKNIEIFVQVNIGEESQKNGIEPRAVRDFIAFARKELALNVTGLMCVPPANEAASPYFALLNKLAQENAVPKLSMGMSADFEDAIALGATHIRLGTVLFGKRF